jgi:curved DNA-binding protein CbpA
MTGRHEAEDLYNILGVAANVSPERIKEQFRFLVQAFHPDKHASPTHKARAEEMLRKVTEAYRVLSDPLQRSAYDRRRATNTAIFEELGALQRERVQAVDGQAHSSPVAHAQPPSYARKVVKLFQQGCVCSECGGRVREQARFCLHCGKTFAADEAAEEIASAPSQPQKLYSKLRGIWTCSSCRGVVQPQSSFCIHCGQSFDKSHS